MRSVDSYRPSVGGAVHFKLNLRAGDFGLNKEVATRVVKEFQIGDARIDRGVESLGRVVNNRKGMRPAFDDRQSGEYGRSKQSRGNLADAAAVVILDFVISDDFFGRVAAAGFNFAENLVE